MADALNIGRLTLERPLIAGRCAARFGAELADAGALKHLGAIITDPLSLHPVESNRKATLPGASPHAPLTLPAPRALSYERFATELEDSLAELTDSNACAAIIPLVWESLSDALALADRLGSAAGVQALLLRASLGSAQRDALLEAVQTLRQESELALIVELPLNASALTPELAQAGADGVIACALPSTGMKREFVQLGPHLLEPMLAECAQAAMQLPVIAQGGIFTHRDVLRALADGASALALNASLISQPELARTLHQHLRDLRRKDPALTLQELAKQALA